MYDPIIKELFPNRKSLYMEQSFPPQLTIPLNFRNHMNGMMHSGNGIIWII